MQWAFWTACCEAAQRSAAAGLPRLPCFLLAEHLMLSIMHYASQ